MKPALRRIAITVTEPRPGHFGWQLLKREAEGEGECTVIEEHGALSERYASAMAAGLVQLERLVGDLDNGPRQVDVLPARGRGRARGQSHTTPDDAAEDSPPSDAVPVKRGRLFGFGPLC